VNGGLLEVTKLLDKREDFGRVILDGLDDFERNALASQRLPPQRWS